MAHLVVAIAPRIVDGTVEAGHGFLDMSNYVGMDEFCHLHDVSLMWDAVAKTITDVQRKGQGRP